MVDLNNLKCAAAREHGSASAAFTVDGDGVTFRSGRAARWIQRFRTSENRRIAHRFLQSLQQTYGGHVLDQILESSRLGAALSRGKPLRARHVLEAVGQADGFAIGLRTWNAALARTYAAPGAWDPHNARLRARIEREARRIFPGNLTAAGLLNTGAIARRVRAAIVEAGRGGTRLITTNDAADVLTRVVTEELSAAFRSRSVEALGKLSLDAPDSIASQALAAAAGKFEPPLKLDAARLTPDARDAMNGRFRASIADGSIPAPLLNDEPSLRALADKVVGGFLEERADAARAVAQSPIIGAREKEAMRDQVVHDNVPARLVPALAWAYVANADDVAALGTPLGTKALQEKVYGIRSAMTGAFSESGTEIDEERTDALCRMFWRFLLAPAQDAHTLALADWLGPPGSPLRAIGEAANGYAGAFPVTDEAGRAPQSEPESDEKLPVWYEDSSRKAARIAAMMKALVAVANEKLEASERIAPLAAHDQVPDQTIATLRNLGVPMPAPDRVGDVNPKVPISTPGLRAIRQELAAHMRSKGTGRFQDGVLQESIKDYDRNTYRIEGRELPLDKEAVVRELRRFCTDGDNRLNEQMLKTLSMVAYQAMPGCVLATCLNPLRSEVAVFDGSPTLDPFSRSYNLSMNHRGDVLVNCELSGPVIRHDRIDRNGDPQFVEMDPSASLVRIDMTVGIDAGTAEPELQDVRIGYSLIPLQAPPAPDA